MKESEILNKAKKGDPNALTELLRYYQGKIYAVAIALTGNKEEAKDLTQDTYLIICNKITQCQKTFLPWTLRIMRNLFIDKIKKKKVREVLISHEDLSSVVEDTKSVEEQIEFQDLKKNLLKGLSDLPLDYRLVLVLYHIEGLSINEISTSLDLKEGTVKSKLHRGRILLRGALLSRTGDDYYGMQ